MSMKRAVLALSLIFASLVVGEAQIAIPYTFTTGTNIASSQVNANFAAVGANACNLTGCTMQGVLTTLGLLPTADATSDIGGAVTRYRDIFLSRDATIGRNLILTGTTGLNGRTYTWPSSETANAVLTTNGSGTLSWGSTGVNVTAAKTTNYSAVLSDFVVCNGAITITLPASSGNSGKIIDVKNIHASATCTVQGNAAETIDGSNTYLLSSQYQSITVVSDGTNWYIR